ncbi:MAG: ABC transporter permease [Acidobacteriota bacterium]
MSFRGFIWKNGTRNKHRAILTIFSVALALFVMATLMSFVRAIEKNLDLSNPLRLIVRHAVSLANPLPERYYAQIQKTPGIAAVTTLNWFGGIYIDRAHTDFAQFSCEPDTFFDVYKELRITPEGKQAFVRERTAAIAGRRLAEKHGWKLGDRITLKGAIYPADMELTIRAFFDSSINQEGAVYFHRDYLEEALGRPGIVGTFSVLANSAEAVPRIAEQIDGAFQNTDFPTKTETERAFTMGFISMLGNLRTLIATISAVIIFTILLVTANTMAMSVRERIREIAVLKSLGFRRRTVMLLLIAEGVFIALLGGLIGAVGARIAFSSVDMAALSQGFFQRLDVTAGIIGIGLGVAFVVGLLSAGIPAFQAAKLTVADGLRHVG